GDRRGEPTPDITSPIVQTLSSRRRRNVPSSSNIPPLLLVQLVVVQPRRSGASLGESGGCKLGRRRDTQRSERRERRDGCGRLVRKGVKLVRLARGGGGDAWRSECIRSSTSARWW